MTGVQTGALPIGDADRPGQGAHPFHGLVDLRRLAQHEAQSPAAGRYVADVDAPALALPQFGPDALLDHLKPLLCDVAGVGFQQDVAADRKSTRLNSSP